MARLTGKQRRKKQEEKRTTITPKPVKGDTKKVKIKGRTRTRYYDGKKWVDKAVYKGTPKLSKIEQRTEELRIRNRANEELLTKNRAALAIKGASRNWDNPVGDELWKEDTMEPETGGWDEVEGGQPNPTTITNLQATNKYKAEKFEKERQAGWAGADLQDAKDLRIGSKAGMTEWTTDQKASDLAIPSDKQDQSGMGKDVKPIESGTSEKWTGEVGSRKLTNPTAIQKKLIKAGHSEENLVKLMINYKKKYKDKRGW